MFFLVCGKIFLMKITVEDTKIIIEKTNQFDIKDILECGQIFSFKRLEDNSYFVVSMNKTAVIQEFDDRTEIKSKDINYFYNFFDLSTDYEQIKENIFSNHKEFDFCKEFGKGIRILKQDPFQIIISFIVSANNNIKRIKNILFKMSEQFGTKIEGTNFYSFPTLNQLLKATKDDFDNIGAGYRSEYLVQTIKILNSKDFDLNKLKSLNTTELKSKLLLLKGVGPKVADCILLFGFYRLDVFPVDTWIRKAYYIFETKKLSDENISKYFVSKFGNLSGYAQQYLYNFMLNKSN